MERVDLKRYTLQGVEETGEELGRGSYAVVSKVTVNGLSCAAKQLHQALYDHGVGYAAKRFLEECALLSRLRHPNIVQFLGVYSQVQQERIGGMLPALVMEYLPLTLAQCLDQYGILSNEVSYSILKDVALALSYLHQQSPPVIHRDLSANNVLLTSGMTAKVSDLGVAKILDLNPSQMRSMTQNPGTQCYMPPEAMVPHSNYSSKVDVFSYGVLTIHVFSGQWPYPTEAVKVDPRDYNRMIPQSEADRRCQLLDAIGRDHPLLKLTLSCIHNSPARRPEAVEILRQVSKAVGKFPASSRNKLELLQQVSSLKADAEKLQAEIGKLREGHVAELEKTKKAMQAEMLSTQVQIKEAEQEKERKLEDAERCHSVEVEQLKLALTDAKHTLSSSVSELEAEVKYKEDTLRLKQSVIASKDSVIHGLVEQLDQLRESHTLKALSAHEAERKLLNQTTHVLEESVEYLNVQLPKAPNIFPQGGSLGWNTCEEIPKEMSCAQAVVIRGEAFVGGGDVHDYCVHKYSPSTNKWSNLADAPVYWFGMGQISGGELVLVGGKTRKNVETGVVLTYVDKKWKESIPAMPTARCRLAVFSQPSCLTAVGGRDQQDTWLSVVEVYIPQTSQWHMASPAPFTLSDITSTVIYNKCYLAEYYSSHVVELHVHVSVPCSTTGSFESSLAQVSTSWKVLTDLPHKKSALGQVNGCLLAVGGYNSSARIFDRKFISNVHAFCPVTNTWKKIGDLPEPRCNSTTVFVPVANAAVLGGGEMLVMGGKPKQINHNRQVWRATFQFDSIVNDLYINVKM